MAAAPSYADDLPTIRLPSPLPPPLPRRASMASIAEVPAIPAMPATPRMAMPAALDRGTIVIQIPVGQLSEAELAQIMAWVQGRSSSMEVRTPTAALRATEWLSDALADAQVRLGRQVNRARDELDAQVARSGLTLRATRAREWVVVTLRSLFERGLAWVQAKSK